MLRTIFSRTFEGVQTREIHPRPIFLGHSNRAHRSLLAVIDVARFLEVSHSCSLSEGGDDIQPGGFVVNVYKRAYTLWSEVL